MQWGECEHAPRAASAWMQVYVILPLVKSVSCEWRIFQIIIFQRYQKKMFTGYTGFIKFNIVKEAYANPPDHLAARNWKN